MSPAWSNTNNVTEIILEKGVTIRRTQDGTWTSQALGDGQQNAIPEEISRQYSLRPVLLTKRVLPSSKHERTLLLSNDGASILDIELSQLSQAYDPDNAPSLFRTLNLTYIVGAVIYHCKQLARTYSDIVREFASLPFVNERNSPDVMNLSNTPAPYYEFDALAAAALRSYDTSRYIIWNLFGPAKGSVPSSFARTLPHCERLLLPLRQRLEASWSNFGERLKDYRDCAQHYVQLADPIPFARMEPLPQGVWATSFRIPDNPETRSHKQFRYDLKLDALTYGWELTNEIVKLGQEIVHWSAGSSQTGAAP